MYEVNEEKRDEKRLFWCNPSSQSYGELGNLKH